MSDNESTRKRSRSPTDSDYPKNKRLKSGAESASGNSTGPLSQSSSSRITMADSSAARPNDSTNSPPSSTRHKDAHPPNDSSAATTSAEPSSATNPPPPPSAPINMRSLIVTQDASIIIGKGGSHVNEIREKSGARVMVSESIPGNPERILNVSGPLDAVSKVSRAYPLSSYCANLVLSRHSVLLSVESTTNPSMFLQFQEVAQ